MRADLQNVSSFQNLASLPLLFGSVLAAVLALALSVASLQAETGGKVPIGIAWRVIGQWQVEGQGASVRTGDAIVPGSLLEPSATDGDHSITVLLPDGQSILDECFTEKDCARGFRVPKLDGDPAPFTAHLIERIHAALVQQRTHPRLVLAVHSRAARDEAVAVLGTDNRIEISGLAAALSDGRYVYDLTPIGSGVPPQTGIPFQKAGHSIALTVPGPGVYRLRIVDPLRNPRIDGLIAAVRLRGGAEIVDDFHKAHALFEDWVENYQGWPVHDFQRAYLEALMLNIRPAAEGTRTAPASAGPGLGVTAEPVFSPNPGVSAGDMAVALRCATPGASIHYTIDGSQPFDSSPVYGAPIIMKRIPLRIKAFAESPGKKDSPVVTGFFRIGQQ